MGGGGGKILKKIGDVATTVYTGGLNEVYGKGKDILVDDPKKRMEEANAAQQAQINAEQTRQADEKKRIGPGAVMGDPSKNFDALRRRRFNALRYGFASTVKSRQGGAGTALASNVGDGLKTKLGQ